MPPKIKFNVKSEEDAPEEFTHEIAGGEFNDLIAQEFLQTKIEIPKYNSWTSEEQKNTKDLEHQGSLLKMDSE